MLISYICHSDLTHLAREKAKADAEFYRILKDAEANKVCEKAKGDVEFYQILKDAEVNNLCV